MSSADPHTDPLRRYRTLPEADHRGSRPWRHPGGPPGKPRRGASGSDSGVAWVASQTVEKERAGESAHAPFYQNVCEFIVYIPN